MKTKACFTLQHDEYDFLPIWVRWYATDFKPEDMYIMAHNSSPEMLEMLKQAEKDGINVEYLNTEVIFDHDWLNAQVHRKQRELLEKYDWVLFTDCDELIIPTDTTLTEFIDKATNSAYRCDGYELQNEDFMYKSIGFCKTSLSSIPLIYTHGYHQSQPQFEISENLRMYHIHKIDWEKSWARNQRIANEKWDAYAVQMGLGTHNHISGEQDYRNFWVRDVPSEEHHLPIPPEILQKIKG
jgi:hypothetical protein